MSLKGTLATMSIPELLSWIQYSGKTGTLLLQRRACMKRAHFDKGRVVAATSNDPREFLGQVVVSLGIVTESQLNDAFKKQAETQRLLGRILIEDFGISEEAIKEAIHHKTEESLYDLFLWKEGVFRFSSKRDSIPEYECLNPALDVEPLLMEGARRADVWSGLLKIFPSRFCKIVKSEKIPDSGLEDTNRVLSTVMACLDRPKTIEELTLVTHASHYLVYEALGILVRGKVINVERVEPSEAQRAEAELEATLDLLHHIFEGAQAAYKQGQDVKAIEMLEDLLVIEENHEQARLLLQKARAEFKRKWMEQISMDSVLEINAEIGDPTPHLHSNQEAFVLSRINGMWNVKSIISVLPLSEHESMQIVQNLLNQKLVRIRKGI